MRQGVRRERAPGQDGAARRARAAAQWAKGARRGAMRAAGARRGLAGLMGLMGPAVLVGLLMSLPIGLLGGPGAVWAQPAPPEARNLLIELRQVDGRQADAGGLGVEGGSVVVHSDGRVSSGLRGGAQVRSTRSSSVASQQLRVMNGMPASIRLGQSVPLQLWQAWVTPQGVQAVPTTVFVDAGQGFAVRPSWPGGAAPVTLEVVSESSRLAQPGMASRWEQAVAETRAARGEAPPPGAVGAVDSARVLTTLAVPLGQWVTLAESGTSSVREERGLLSTGQVESGGGMRVEVRVTAP